MACNPTRSGSIDSGSIRSAAEATRYRRLVEKQPKFEEHDCSSKIAVVLSDIDVDSKTILKQLHDGLSDFWIPMSKNVYPRGLTPSDYQKYELIESRLLVKNFVIGSPDQWPGEHFHLSSDAIDEDSQLPNTLKYVRSIGGSNNTEVAEVKFHSGTSYALKRIERMKSYNEELEQMKYIKGEISALRKLRNVCHRHFVKLVASYTDTLYVGMLLCPVADCNLGEFMDNYPNSEKPDAHLLAGFFGCLTTALVDLHYVKQIRHKDIKPENILVKSNNVLLTDFGIALDWSKSGRTTTHEEKRKSTTYCAPEVFENHPRNSKSDIWSLGCVFLEMVAVLKGEGRKAVHDMLESHGPRRFSASRQSIEYVISELKRSESQYNVPLGWVEQMLKWRQEDRPNATELRDRILGVEQEAYCGICCRRTAVFKDDPTGNQWPLFAKIFVANGISWNNYWCDVKVTQVPSLHKNWISRGIVMKYGLEVYKSEAMEMVMLDGIVYMSTEYTKVTWMAENASRTLKEEFLVATVPTPFEVLVTEASYLALLSVPTT
ncbi:kinase-like protein [Daldinia eschscholtzii]|nr:kinase-like protein [Daldinia eschscholtzii]